jgi:hypothetical protein
MLLMMIESDQKQIFFYMLNSVQHDRERNQSLWKEKKRMRWKFSWGYSTIPRIDHRRG